MESVWSATPVGSKGKAPGEGQVAKPPEASDIPLIKDIVSQLKCI